MAGFETAARVVAKSGERSRRSRDFGKAARQSKRFSFTIAPSARFANGVSRVRV